MEMETQDPNHVRLQLHLYASNLPRVGIRKIPPDCSAVVKFLEGSGSLDTLQEAKGTAESSTEIIEKSCHPQWTKVFSIDYEHGAKQFFSVQIIRHQSGESEQDTIYGGAVFEISDILASKQTKAKTLRNGGCVFVHLHPVTDWGNQEKIFRFQFCALELDVRTKSLSDVFNGSPDTFVELAKRQVSPGGYTWITVYRSSPTWDVGQLDLETCCNGDLNHPLRLSVWLHKQGAHEVLLGMCETTVQNLLYALNEWSLSEASSEGYPDDKILFIRKPPSRRIKNSGENKTAGKLGVKMAKLLSANDSVLDDDSDSDKIVSMGDISFDSVLPPPTSASSIGSTPSKPPLPTSPSPPPIVGSITPKPCFEDYLEDGCLLDVCTAIDFTSSNGDPRKPGTLHYRAGDELNEYETSIEAVIDAIEIFSECKEISVWGFGAKFGGTIRHIFQCGASSIAAGTNGVLEAYRSVFQSDLIMSAPTYLVNVIQAAAVRARRIREERNSQKKYCILLIVTNGGVKDINETKRKLSVYSDMPLSVIIVGVGQSDFPEMSELQNLGTRRNVAFVKLRDHNQDSSSMGMDAVQDVQNQIVDYMMRNRIYPSGHGKHQKVSTNRQVL